MFPEDRHDAVVAALRRAHPYEEPAFDVYALRVKARLYTDGGARGNPGPAAYGYVLEAEDGTVLAAHGETIGVATNNVAEYSGLIAGLAKAVELAVPEVEVVSDSELMVKQMRGEYRVKNARSARPLARGVAPGPPARQGRLPPRRPRAERARRPPRQRRAGRPLKLFLGSCLAPGGLPLLPSAHGQTDASSEQKEHAQILTPAAIRQNDRRGSSARTRR